MLGHKGVLWLEAQTSGITAHGSMPEQGVNAIYKAANAVTKLEKYDFGVTAHPLMGKPTLNVGTISGGININSVPDRATIGIDIRTIPGQEHSDVHEGIKSCLGSEVELSRVLDLGGVMTDPDDDWIKQVFHMMEGVLGERPVPTTMSGFTDVSVLKPFFGNPPTVILGPGEVTMAHKTDEFCYISKIEEAVEVYTEITRKWCEF
jgi:succinyl-diaminopimelate desuccinylase